jgi:hypothetical protein
VVDHSSRPETRDGWEAGGRAGGLRGGYGERRRAAAVRRPRDTARGSRGGRRSSRVGRQVGWACLVNLVDTQPAPRRGSDTAGSQIVHMQSQGASQSREAASGTVDPRDMHEHDIRHRRPSHAKAGATHALGTVLSHAKSLTRLRSGHPETKRSFVAGSPLPCLSDSSVATPRHRIFNAFHRARQ